MFVRAGVVSLGLLLLSRVLGLLRETAQSAAFGTTGLGDLAVLMLGLPDWFAGLVASGALSYVLLPYWAAQNARQQELSMRRVARALLWLGVVCGALLVWQREAMLGLLVPGVPVALRHTGHQALVWSAFAFAPALLAALWATRAQHLRDFSGLYGGHLVVNLVLVIALFLVAVRAYSTGSVAILGTFLLVAMGARLLWLHGRLRRHRTPLHPGPAEAGAPLPTAALWVWAGLAAALPLTLPFAARSLASQGGEGALATFNYAWKLVELPLVLAIQLVATLAFPGIARALAQPADPHQAAAAAAAIRAAFALAWTLACAAAAVLLVAAPALSSFLFGWGRMGPEGLARVAAWGSAAAWGLLPQALIAVALTVLAGLGRLRWPVVAYGLALLLLLVIGASGSHGGATLMRLLNGVLLLVAVLSLLALGRQGLRHWLPWGSLWPAPLLLLGTAAAGHLGVFADIQDDTPVALAAAAGFAMLVIAGGWLGGPDLRRALRR